MLHAYSSELEPGPASPPRRPGYMPPPVPGSPFNGHGAPASASLPLGLGPNSSTRAAGGTPPPAPGASRLRAGSAGLVDAPGHAWRLRGSDAMPSTEYLMPMGLVRPLPPALFVVP